MSAYEDDDRDPMEDYREPDPEPELLAEWGGDVAAHGGPLTKAKLIRDLNGALVIEAQPESLTNGWVYVELDEIITPLVGAALRRLDEQVDREFHHNAFTQGQYDAAVSIVRHALADVLKRQIVALPDGDPDPF